MARRAQTLFVTLADELPAFYTTAQVVRGAIWSGGSAFFDGHSELTCSLNWQGHTGTGCLRSRCGGNGSVPHTGNWSATTFRRMAPQQRRTACCTNGLPTRPTEMSSPAPPECTTSRRTSWPHWPQTPKTCARTRSSGRPGSQPTWHPKAKHPESASSTWPPTAPNERVRVRLRRAHGSPSVMRRVYLRNVRQSHEIGAVGPRRIQSGATQAAGSCPARRCARLGGRVRRDRSRRCSLVAHRSPPGLSGHHRGLTGSVASWSRPDRTRPRGQTA